MDSAAPELQRRGSAAALTRGVVRGKSGLKCRGCAGLQGGEAIAALATVEDLAGEAGAMWAGGENGPGRSSSFQLEAVGLGSDLNGRVARKEDRRRGAGPGVEKVFRDRDMLFLDRGMLPSMSKV